MRPLASIPQRLIWGAASLLRPARPASLLTLALCAAIVMARAEAPRAQTPATIGEGDRSS